MQLDYVDIVYAHRPDPSVPIEETVRAFNWCIENGLAFYWGMVHLYLPSIGELTVISMFRYLGVVRR